MLATHALCLKHRADFPAGITGVKFIHNVAERGKIVIAFQTVHTVIDGDQPDAALPQNLHDLADFQIIVPQAAHVFDNNGLHPSGLDFLHHRQKSGAVKTGAGDTIIGKVRRVGQDTAGLRIGEIGELAASVFQDPRSQFFTVNSSNEVAFGLENHGLPQDKIRQRVDAAFRIFHLERLKDRNVYELSSGERQFISILSAWAMDTDIFLLDEPTANLDFAATQQLKEILLALKRQGKTLLLSEHRLYYLADIADEFWVMADGEIKGKYTAAEAKAFSAERRQTLSLRTLDLAEITVPEKEPLPKTTPTALAVSDVRYTYGRKAGDTLSGVSFSVREHEIVGLVGANGCGKTTIGKLIAGLYRPSGGRIMLFGKPQNPKQLQKQVLFILQEAEFQFFTNSVLHELQYGHKVTPEFEQKTEALLKRMDMWDCRDRHPFSLSGGQMQRLTLMTA